MDRTVIRALRPTDVVAYLAFCRQLDEDVDGERVRSWQRLRIVPEAAGLVGRSLPLGPARESWIRIERGQIYGLVATRRRIGADIWDVDELAVLPTPDAGNTVVHLLDRVLGAAIQEGIHKVFLRLPEGDPAQEWVRQVGFYPYCREEVYYRGELPGLAQVPNVPGLRPRRPVDHQPLFQLYSAVVPFRVRQAEAMTLHEWRWLDGWTPHRVGLDLVLRTGRSDFVLTGPDRPTAWLQTDRRTRTIGLLADSDCDLAELFRFAVAQLGGGRAAWCSVRDYQAGQSGALQELGFSSVARNVLFARALAVRVPEMKLVPIRA